MEEIDNSAGAPDTGINDAEIDALLGDAPAPEAAPAPEPAAAPAPQDLEFQAAGKQIKAPITDPRVKQWLSQGYDYAQRMQEFNQKHSEWEKSQKEFEPLRARYSEVDQYIQQNPQWWEHVQQAWQQRESAGQPAIDPSNPLTQKLTALEQKLEDFNKFKSTLETERQTYTKQVEDQQLNAEIESIRKTYPNLDLSQVDPATGKTLEWQTMEFATQRGIKDFSVAFHAFNHEKLMKLAEERGLEKAAKNIQSRTKMGLLDKNRAPGSGQSNGKNIKQQSYDDLFEESLVEYGING
jgi:hypothetical protein